MSAATAGGQGELIELILNNTPRVALASPGLWNLVVISTAWAGRTVTINVGNRCGDLVPLTGATYTDNEGSPQFGGKFFQAVSSNGNYENLSVSLRKAD